MLVDIDHCGISSNSGNGVRSVNTKQIRSKAIRDIIERHARADADGLGDSPIFSETFTDFSKTSF